MRVLCAVCHAPIHSINDKLIGTSCLPSIAAMPTNMYLHTWYPTSDYTNYTLVFARFCSFLSNIIGFDMGSIWMPDIRRIFTASFFPFSLSILCSSLFNISISHIIWLFESPFPRINNIRQINRYVSSRQSGTQFDFIIQTDILLTFVNVFIRFGYFVEYHFLSYCFLLNEHRRFFSEHDPAHSIEMRWG